MNTVSTDRPIVNGFGGQSTPNPNENSPYYPSEPVVTSALDLREPQAPYEAVQIIIAASMQGRNVIRRRHIDRMIPEEGSARDRIQRLLADVADHWGVTIR